MEAAAAGQPRSLLRALARPRPQERPGCPPAPSAKAEARVLVINTGGTIGMVQDVKGEGPAAGRGVPGWLRGAGLAVAVGPGLPCHGATAGTRRGLRCGIAGAPGSL